MKSNSYLSFNGQCEAAFKFYEQAIGAKILVMMTYGDSPAAEMGPPEFKSAIIHGQILVGETVLMAGDAPPHLYSKPAGISVSLTVDTPEDAERIYPALSEGGEVKMPLEETFFAHRFAMFIDRFGIPWMLICEKPM